MGVNFHFRPVCKNVSMAEELNQILDELEDHGNLTDPLRVLSAFQDWANSTGRPLYPHQQEAAEHLILEDRHLIAPTPTGSGKSLIGVAAVLWALARGGVAYYTAPLKALVSEKFFELVRLFGARNVGMVTGDGSVNADAPIICATAEILANQALRWGDDLDVDTVVMDEFHYYTDPERGWAWQAPLITLTQTRFVLLSATLGDTSYFEKYLEQHTGRQVAVLDSAQRPVPLVMEYTRQATEKLLLGLSHQDRLPAYLVHSSQRAAVEEAQKIASGDLDLGLSPNAASRLREEVTGVSFNSSFGKILRPLLLSGIAVHHAGMLPRYRRLVERLAGLGLLKAISGTDTLGVGINVPIRTVVMTSLVKFDGTKERHLTAREFHQVAGRAGRAGFDTVGYVEVQAPEWEIENAAALSQAGDDPKKLAKIKKKQAPKDRASWTEGTFTRLQESQPEAMNPKWKITHAMVLNTLQRPGNQAENLLDLALKNHAALRATGPTSQHNRFLDTLGEVLESLESSEVIRRVDPEAEGGEQLDIIPALEQGKVAWKLTADLPQSFALNQALAPFALDYLNTFPTGAETPKPDLEPGNTPPGLEPGNTPPNPAPTPNGFGQTLDVISVIEAVLDNPMVILNSQQRRERDVMYNTLRAQGVEYNQRKVQLEEVFYPKPLEAELDAAFQIYCQANPWAKGYVLEPKTILREMIEQGATFTSYVQRLGITYSEGVLLRYLSEAYRSLEQIVPPALRNSRFREIQRWLEELLSKVDSSLIDEWKLLENPALLDSLQEATGSEEPELAFGQRQDGSFDYLVNPQKLQAEVHRQVLEWLDLLGGDLFEKLAQREAGLRQVIAGTVVGPEKSSDTGAAGKGAVENGMVEEGAAKTGAAGNSTSGRPIDTELGELPPVTEDGWDKQLGHYWDTHDFMDCAADARNRKNFTLITDPSAADLPPKVQRDPRITRVLDKAADQGKGLWLAELRIVDGDQDLDFGLFALIDPKASNENHFPVWLPLGLLER